MEVVNREEMKKEILPGRTLQKAVGKGSAIVSEKMTVGFARYSAEAGPMQPHNHAEETVLVLDADNGWVRYGEGPEKLDTKVPVKRGTVLHFAPLEWHVFEYGKGGYVDAVFIYGQVDNIRPEEILAAAAKA